MEIPGFSESTKTILAVIAGIGIAFYGGYNIIQQSSALDNAEEINVTIESKGVDTVSQRRGVQYRPTAKFKYDFNGEGYSSDNVYPSGVAQKFNSEDDASQVVEKYNTGENFTGYIDPESPENAFLVNESSNSPYLMILIGLVMAAIGIGLEFQG